MIEEKYYSFLIKEAVGVSVYLFLLKDLIIAELRTRYLWNRSAQKKSDLYLPLNLTDIRTDGRTFVTIFFI